VDSFVSVERHNERVLILKTVLGNVLLNILAVYAPHSGKLEEKKSFWKEMIHLVSCIPQNEMVVLTGDINGHVGSSNVELRNCDSFDSFARFLKTIPFSRY